MGKGYIGKILWVDLTTGKMQIEEPAEVIYRNYLGGYALGAYFLYQRHRKFIDALGPENILGFTPGLLTGTGVQFAGRWMAVGKSPLTGTWGDANCGGNLSPAIKKAGFDAVFIEGVSSKPIYLYIEDGKAEIRDASDLWGKNALETEQILQDRLGKNVAVATIGKSGELISLISGIVNDRGRLAARSGLGAVMGAKKLKAIAFKGTGKIEIHDQDLMKNLVKRYLDDLKNGLPLKDLLMKIISKAGIFYRLTPIQPRNEYLLYRDILKTFGTCGTTAYSAEGGDAPVKNWKGSGYHDFPVSTHSSKISDHAVIAYERKKYHCYACPIGCGGIVDIPEGPNKHGEMHKPEYETLTSFGTLLLNNDLESIMLLNQKCNEAGIDTISAGSVIAFAMECYEQGIITRDEFGGIEPIWGNVPAIFKLLDMIINREGIGDILADGVRIASSKIGRGSEQFAIHAGGQELPMHDPRFDPTFGLAYHAEPTPGRHTIISQTYLEMMRLERKFKEAKRYAMAYWKADKYKAKGKAKMQAIGTKYVQVTNALGFCVFASYISDLPLKEYIKAATGWDIDYDEMLKIGERIETLRHCYNIKQGIKPWDTSLTPRAIGRPPLTKGPLAGVTLDQETMVKEFYQEFDWDIETGIPAKKRLEELGLSQVIEDFYK